MALFNITKHAQVKFYLNRLGYIKMISIPCLNINDIFYTHFFTKYTIQDSWSILLIGINYVPSKSNTHLNWLFVFCSWISPMALMVYLSVHFAE